ncbi:MAG TPA: rRNA maturation RNase YbeY [Chryseobacterium sp.]|nr:rRNA maturation RNase YbeY [Chryseobacterium sp.]
MSIEFHFEDVAEFPVTTETISWLENLLQNEEKKTGKIVYIFCSDEYLLEVNRQYLKHDYYTDIITFDYVKGKTVSGDIFVSLPRIFENAEMHNTSTDKELHRVLAHGLLHLSGYKDKSDEEQVIMRDKEDFYLAKRT